MVPLLPGLGLVIRGIINGCLFPHCARAYCFCLIFQPPIYILSVPFSIVVVIRSRIRLRSLRRKIDLSSDNRTRLKVFAPPSIFAALPARGMIYHRKFLYHSSCRSSRYNVFNFQPWNRTNGFVKSRW